jgi:5-methylthioadenosine/S-adenosylhomocysteine deaminase
MRQSRAWHHLLPRIALVVGAVLRAAAAVAQPSVTPGDPARVLLKGLVVRPGGPISGEVLVSGEWISCAAESCPAPGATVIDTKGIIYPGLMDAHNHAAFSMFDEADWIPAKAYKNHNQWPATDPGYKKVMAAKKHLETVAALPCEMDKYGEIKALMAGTTSILLAPKSSARSCFASLARTIDTQFNDLTGEDTIQASISVPTNDEAKRVCDAINSGKIHSYVVHVGEGVDETSRKEFDTLAGRAGGCLLRPETTIIHGTAFGKPEFERMAAHNMALVWSPKSNLFLYKREDGKPATPDIAAAIDAGVNTIALGPDWALGGSTNLLDELRVANKVARDQSWSKVTPERLFRMVTIDAAKALGVASLLGSIEAGKRADLMVLGDGGDPFAALLKATSKDVRLVMVNGKTLFGDQSLSAAAAFSACDAVSACGTQKFLCVAEPDGTAADKRRQRLGEVTGALQNALTAYDASLGAGAKRFMPLAPLLSACPQ